jgi:hypothetical protein
MAKTETGSRAGRGGAALKAPAKGTTQAKTATRGSTKSAAAKPAMAKKATRGR